MFSNMLLDHGLHFAGIGIPWSVLIFIVIIAVGLLLIRAAITLVKVAIIVAIGVAIFLLVQFVLRNFG